MTQIIRITGAPVTHGRPSILKNWLGLEYAYISGKDNNILITEEKVIKALKKHNINNELFDVDFRYYLAAYFKNYTNRVYGKTISSEQFKKDISYISESIANKFNITLIE